MSSPVISGFERKEVTFKLSSSVTQGDVVTLLSNHEVTIPYANTLFCGVCAAIRDGYGSIVMRGPVTVRYSGTVPSIGYCLLSSKGDGSVMIDKTSGTPILVTDLDTTNGTCEILL